MLCKFGSPCSVLCVCTVDEAFSDRSGLEVPQILQPIVLRRPNVLGRRWQDLQQTQPRKSGSLHVEERENDAGRKSKRYLVLDRTESWTLNTHKIRNPDDTAICKAGTCLKTAPKPSKLSDGRRGRPDRGVPPARAALY